jgi:hypothetical protein
MADIERELGWDDEIENDSSFTLFPEGDYPFTVVSLERGRFAGSDKMPPCPMAMITIEIDGGRALGKQNQTVNLMLHTKTEWKLCEFFRSIGLRQHGEKISMPWNKVVGASGGCHISQVPGYKDPTKTYNQVDKFLDPVETSGSDLPFTEGKF